MKSLQWVIECLSLRGYFKSHIVDLGPFVQTIG